MHLDPYGWNSPEQIAERTAQRLDMRAARRDVTIPRWVTATLRQAVRADLHVVMVLERVDRYVFAPAPPRR